VQPRRAEMPNLLEETVSVLDSFGLTRHDVQWCGSFDGKFFFDWEQFATLANREYYAGYGGQEVARDLVIVGTDWWLSREDYDGKEWWRFNKMPEPANDGHLMPTTLFPRYPFGFLGDEEGE
jgi:hypothetical protein